MTGVFHAYLEVKKAGEDAKGSDNNLWYMYHIQKPNGSYLVSIYDKKTGNPEKDRVIHEYEGVRKDAADSLFLYYLLQMQQGKLLQYLKSIGITL